jgi:hypothetical protein
VLLPQRTWTPLSPVHFPDHPTARRHTPASTRQQFDLLRREVPAMVLRGDCADAQVRALQQELVDSLRRPAAETFLEPPPAGEPLHGAPRQARHSGSPPPRARRTPPCPAGCPHASGGCSAGWRQDAGRALAHLQRLLAAGRGVLLQPYLARVDQQGETAVLYLGGTFSHAIRTGPLLRSGAALVDGLFAPEDIRPRVPEPMELEVSAAAYHAIPFASPAYARIDLIRDEAGAPVVLELELTEPSLFLLHASGAAERFARHLVQRLLATEGTA